MPGRRKVVVVVVVGIGERKRGRWRETERGDIRGGRERKRMGDIRGEGRRERGLYLPFPTPSPSNAFYCPETGISVLIRHS